MMRLLPGDQLWDRYRVERVASDALDCAWLSPLHAPKGRPRDDAGRFLMLSLARPARQPLAEFLATVGACMRLRSSTTSSESTRSSRRKRGTAPAVPDWPASFPLMGAIHWVGGSVQDGVAIIEAPEGKDVGTLIRDGGPLSAAQVLPILLRFLDALQEWQRLFWDGAPAAQRGGVLRTMARLLHPDAMILRASDASLSLRPAFQRPAAEFHPPASMGFIAPEMFRHGVTPGPEAWVFGAARLAAYFLCGPDDPATPATAEHEWAHAAAWVAGKVDPAKIFRDHPRAAELPEDLREVLAKCLDRRPSRRISTPQKMHQILKVLLFRPWAQLEGRPCAACGFRLLPTGRNTAPRCPCCATEAPAPISTRQRRATAVGSGKGGGTAVLPAVRTAVQDVAVPVPEGMTIIPAGPFLSGEKKVPRTLRMFAIDQTPVTEGVYKEYLNQTGGTPRVGGPGSRSMKYDKHPAIGITWHEAVAFAEHHGKRLPTAHEWEKAARGVDGRKFPFGNAYKTTSGRLRIANDKLKDVSDAAVSTAPVGTYPEGASPYGVLDMAGNVLEWTSSARRAGERIFRAVKGACFMDGTTELARCTAIQYLPPETSEGFLGFRCVKDLD